MNRKKWGTSVRGRCPRNSTTTRRDFFVDRTISPGIGQAHERAQLAEELFGAPERTLKLDRKFPGHITGRILSYPPLAALAQANLQRISEARFEALSIPGVTMMVDDPPPPFQPWEKCLGNVTEDDISKYAGWRALSDEFVRDCLVARQQLGIYDATYEKRHFAFPIHGPGGVVIAEQVLTPDSKRGKNFMTAGAAGNVSPLILGALPHARMIFVTEGPHDNNAVADRTGLWKDPNVCFVTTRGAGRDTVLNGLPWPELKDGQSPPRVFILTQRDTTRGKDGKTPNERWVGKVRALIPFPVWIVPPAEPHKDFNDWTRAGATRDELKTLFASYRGLCRAGTASGRGDGAQDPRARGRAMVGRGA